MNAPGWRSSLVVQVIDPHAGTSVPFVVGILQTQAGEHQLGARIGEHGHPVILPMQSASQLIVNLRTLLEELVTLTGEQDGST